MNVLTPWIPAAGFVMVHRGTGGIALPLPWRVIIDGKRVGYVRRREAVTFKVVPGLHRVQVFSGVAASGTLFVDVSEGERVLLHSRPRRWSFWPDATPVEETPQRHLRRVRIDLERVP